MSTSSACSPDNDEDLAIGGYQPQSSELPVRSSDTRSPTDSPQIKATTSSSSVLDDSQRSSRPQFVSLSRPFSSTAASPSRFQARTFERSPTSSPVASPLVPVIDNDRGIRDLITRSFAPRVAVYASTDTEDFLRGKGIKDGLCGLVRPYGERLHGRVIIRDSIGGSKAWDDFGIRFLDSQQLRQHSGTHPAHVLRGSEVQEHPSEVEEKSKLFYPAQEADLGTVIDQVLKYSLHAENTAIKEDEIGYFDHDSKTANSGPGPSLLYYDYLHKLLSDPTLVPHETFSHPVACMIAVSSHHPAPIEALRQLYASTSHGNDQTPRWMSTEYLRYYVLIHDEENDDIIKSTALFDLMKRHFGLHCHLLRLRASQCVLTDDDSVRVPSCEWISAAEEMDTLRAKDHLNQYETIDSYISESEATAVRAFLREMVTQSIVPFMEKRVMTWNDQVASRRRGISGRFISLSKRWAGLGYSKNMASESGAPVSSSGSNYDYQQGIYPSGTPEATMRQLGDYAFMLRDWRLALSIYDVLRTDFNHDKAWAYCAAANEMSAITSLLISPTLHSKSRSEDIDLKLDNAAYSYLTRCSMPTNAVRCLTLAIELLQIRGSLTVDDAARWGGRLLELNVLTSFAQALMTERLADCYALRKIDTLPISDGRRRQVALWNLLASDCWIRLDRWSLARHRLQMAKKLYDINDQSIGHPPFADMTHFWKQLSHALRSADSAEASTLVNLGSGYNHECSIGQDIEQLNGFTDPRYENDTDKEGFMPQNASHPEDTNVKYLRPLSDRYK